MVGGPGLVGARQGFRKTRGWADGWTAGGAPGGRGQAHLLHPPNAPSRGAPKPRLLWRGSWAKWAGPPEGRVGAGACKALWPGAAGAGHLRAQPGSQLISM